MAGNNTVRILDGNTFVVSEDTGDIEATPTEPTGLFSLDTRYLSKWVLTVDGERLNALSYDDLQYYEARFFLVPGQATHYVDAKLSVIRERVVGGSFRETVSVLNHDENAVDLEIRIDAGADFADLFQVKDEILNKKGELYAEAEPDRLRLGYRRGNFKRETVVSANQPARYDNRGVSWSIHLEPNEQWDVLIDVRTFAIGPGGRDLRDRAGGARHRAARAPARSGGVDRPGPEGQQRARPGSPRPTGAAWSISPRCASPRCRSAGRRCPPPACPGS